jgi:hypothetical protein
MNKKQFARLGLLASLCFSALTPLNAEHVLVGGPHRGGYARPPLRVLIKPATTAAATPYAPAQIRHAYGLDQLNVTGVGQKIAIVDAYGNQNIKSDLTNFSNTFGLKTATVTVLGSNSGGNGNGWDLETSLDVEWAHVVAPDATIILSVAPTASDSDLLAAVDAAVAAGAGVVSMSWGGTEWSTESGYDSHFNKANVTFVASAGDSGELNSLPEVEWPAVSPYVVSVGGTSLYLDANGNRIAGPSGSSETAWSSGGGGLSSYYGLPSWQSGWNTFASKRGVPDVSYVADPNTGLYVYCSTYNPPGWYQVGGTSAGAPQWAALIALANQGRTAAVSGNGDIYNSKVAGNPDTINPANFVDISSGANGSDSDDISVVGYDLVTGLGSPLANSLIPALTGLTGPPPPPPATAPTVNAIGGSGQVSLSWNSVSGATSYNVKRATTSGGETNFASGVTTPGYTDKIVVAGTTYYYEVSAVNASGAGPYSTEVSATPTAAPDFSVSVTPASKTVSRGSATTYAVTITPSSGFTGSVSLSVSGLPSRSSASFSPNPTVSTSTLTVSTNRRSPTGTTTLTITATSGSLQHTKTVALTVQ